MGELRLSLVIAISLVDDRVYVLDMAMYSLQLHSSELEDGYDWGRLNLRSVTEESKLDEFLSTAELAGTEFTAGIYI